MSRIDHVTGAPRLYMDHVNQLSTIPTRVEQLLREQHGRPPRGDGAEEWSVERILMHMTSYAQNVGGFIFRMAWMTDPVLEPWDEEVEAEREDWHSMSVSQLLSRFTEETRNTVELLSETPDAAWGRPGVYRPGGRRSLLQQVQRFISHLEEHVDQLATSVGVEPVGTS
jgi:hypothetical protein